MLFRSNDPGLDDLERQILKYMKYLENNIQDKDILKKKPAKKKKTEKYPMTSNPMLEPYRFAMVVAIWSTRLASEYTSAYLSNITSFWRKKTVK